MTAIVVLLVFLAMGVILGVSFLLAAAGHLWVLGIALVIFFALFAKVGCLPSGGH